MKKGISLAAVYIGLVIGAGFASGREIMQYFNLPSARESGGIVLATFLLALICYLILRRAYLEDTDNPAVYLSAVAGRGAFFVRIIMRLYLFCGFFTMASGCGALLKQVFSVPEFLGSGIFLLICFLILSFRLKGLVRLNLVLVPCMIAGILFVCISDVFQNAIPVFAGNAALPGGSLLAAVCYAGYNTVSAPSVLVPLQKSLTKKEIRIAAVTGGLTLGFLILVIRLAQSRETEALLVSEIPMMFLAERLGKIPEYAYTAVLLMAICTTAVSQGFGFLGQEENSDRRQVLRCGILCMVAYPLSQIRFSALVHYLYFGFGVFGTIWVIWLIVDFYRKP